MSIRYQEPILAQLEKTFGLSTVFETKTNNPDESMIKFRVPERTIYRLEFGVKRILYLPQNGVWIRSLANKKSSTDVWETIYHLPFAQIANQSHVQVPISLIDQENGSDYHRVFKRQQVIEKGWSKSPAGRWNTGLYHVEFQVLYDASDLSHDSLSQVMNPKTNQLCSIVSQFSCTVEVYGQSWGC